MYQHGITSYSTNALKILFIKTYSDTRRENTLLWWFIFEFIILKLPFHFLN